MYHVEGEVNDRMKKMADRYLEKMTLTVGQFSPGFLWSTRRSSFRP